MSPRSALPAYFLVAFGISWAGVLLVATRTGLPAPRGTPEANRYLAFLAMLAGPSLASLGLTALIDGVRGLRELAARLGRWRVGARWYAALLIAPGILALTLGGLSLASPAYAPAIFSAASPDLTIAAALVGGLGAGLFEELGWTGFATPRLLERYRWPRAGFLLGVVWAAWHGLADFWGGAAYGSLWGPHLLEWFVALAAFRMLMTWVYAHTRSLLVGVLLHASSTGGQMLLWPAAGPGEELIWYGLFACALWVAVGVVGLRARRTGA
jgi:membrane protease YdiL (CAAX protease family)